MMNTFILCGGSGERFEGDKCRAEFRGSTVLETVAVLANDPVLVVDDPERFSWVNPRIPFLVDRYPGAGPAAAIAQVIEHARHRHIELLRVVSCDMPTFDPGWWSHLEAAEGPAAAFYDGEHWQPLFSIFRPAEIDLEDDWRDQPAWRLLEKIGAARVEPPEDFDRLVSINTRKDLEAAREIAGDLADDE